MHEILHALPQGSWVLDLGCASGSFAPGATAARCVRADIEAPQGGVADPGAFRVQCDAARLPFRSESFTAVVSNHSLEHFRAADDVLREMGRVVVRDGGSLYVAVPDASTLTDKVYRWLAQGGGHVNAYTSAVDLAAKIERLTGLPHAATRTLCSSVSFLNRRNAPRPIPRRLLLLGGGHEWSLFAYAFLSRRLDRLLGWRTGVYGWAFYFGRVEKSVDPHAWVNVCVRCGSGCPSADLLPQVRRICGVPVYRCRQCGATNPYTDDFPVR